MEKIKLNMSGVIVGINIPSTIIFEVIKTQLKGVIIKNYRLLKTVKYYRISNSNLDRDQILELEEIIEEIIHLKSFDNINEKTVEKKVEAKYKIHYGNLRSGEKINCETNLVIMGSLNPGSYVKCKKSIFVYGKARGTLHAGSQMNKNQNSYIYIREAENPRIKIGSELIFYEEKNTRHIYFQKKVDEILVKKIEKHEIQKIMREIGISLV
ncbi:MAG: hypothetical protein KAH04_02500 [Psychrilyobacter sp.]|nr:hypothetical protein [Psychrilyobacter sp.]